MKRVKIKSDRWHKMIVNERTSRDGNSVSMSRASLMDTNFHYFMMMDRIIFPMKFTFDDCIWDGAHINLAV